jgi:hypothetical protein
LGENDVQRLELKLSEMKTEIIQKIDQVALNQATNYVAKAECAQCKSERNTSGRSGISNTITGLGILVSMVLGIIAIFKGGG